MAPEHEARLRADFYDHENGEPRRRRRPAADWGVNEDIFDRMPSRFARVNRRAEHHDQVVVLRADEGGGRRREVASWGEDAWADEPAARNKVVWDSQRETWRTESRVSAEVSAALDEWRDDIDARGGAAVGYRGGAESAGETRRGAGWADDARAARG